MGKGNLKGLPRRSRATWLDAGFVKGYSKSSMQATLTKATYDAQKNIVIPQERPRFDKFKEVIVLFVPQKSNIITDKAEKFDVLERVWNRNRDVDPEEAASDIEQAIAEVRASKKK